MKILMLGVGSAGSWAIRGHQLGAALGARVTTSPSDDDFAWADLIVIVKRAMAVFGPRASLTGKPIVWDALDFWPQPAFNTLEAATAVKMVRESAGHATVITATQAMANAVHGSYLPHHSWHGLSPTPARAQVKTVAYQGNGVYLGRWAAWVREACRVRGWTFQINPDDLRAVDLLVSFRDGPWDGWICREWKSGVKIVNAMAAGRPIIGQASAASRELRPMGSVVETPEALDVAFDLWASHAERSAVVDDSLSRAPQFTLDAIAQTYRSVLEGVACPA